jgi:hypothetical protein
VQLATVAGQYLFKEKPCIDCAQKHNSVAEGVGNVDAVVVQTRGCARAPATSPSEIACLVPAPTHTDPMEPSRQAENVCIASWVLYFHSEKPLIVNLYTGNVQVNREAAVPALRHDSSWYRISRFPAKPTLPARHRRALCGNI